MSELGMISVVRPRENNSKPWRTCIVGCSGLIAALAIVAIVEPYSSQNNVLLEKKNIPSPSTGILKVQTKLTALKNQPSLSKKTALLKAHTTKLEWQQGWQPNGWQLRDGDWPDEGGRFSEGQTYPEDPATFRIHQTYAFVPGHSRLSKGEADAYWTDLQKRFFRQTPSRTTYPAVPVIFDEDDEGGHARVTPLMHKRNQIYINSMHYPRAPTHFKSVGTKQSLSQLDPPTSSNTQTSSGAEDQLRNEYLESEKQNQILERQLAEVEKSSSLGDSEPVPNGSSLGGPSASMPFEIDHDAGESEDWKEVLFMQGALYEMQKKLAEQEDENQNLRNQLAKWKAKVSTDSKRADVSKEAATHSESEQDQISELKSLIQKIEQQQENTHLENVKLHTQLAAIKKLTLKKASLDNRKDDHQLLKSLPSVVKKLDHAAKDNTNLISKKPDSVAAVDTAEKKSSLIQAAKKLTVPAQHSSASAAISQSPSAATHASAAKAKAQASKPSPTTNTVSNTTVAAASVAAFRKASLATKDAVVRELAAAEESSIDSDAAAIFSSGSAVDEVGDSGRDGFDSLHSLERRALGRPTR